MIELPLEIEPDQDDPDLALPYLTVVLDGRPRRLLLDTGAAKTTVAAPSGRIVRDANGAGGRGLFGGSAVVGETEVRIALGRCDLGECTVRTGAEELLGQDVLSRFRCEYDLVQGVLTLDGPPPTAAHPVRIGVRGHVLLEATWPAVPAAAGEATAGEATATKATAVFDTGAAMTVVDAGFVDAHSDLFAPDGTSTGTDAAGESRATPMARMSGPTILGSHVAESTVAIVDLRPLQAGEEAFDMILGWPILSQATWIIDHRDASGWASAARRGGRMAARQPGATGQSGPGGQA